MSESSTPKLPLTKELSRFIKKIDSFTFDESSPELNSSTSATEPSEEIQRNTSPSATESPKEIQQPAVATSSFPLESITNQPHPDFSTVELRRGRTYRRPRHHSDPTGIEYRCVDSKILEVDSKIFENKQNNNCIIANKTSEQTISVMNVSQIIFNNVPIFSGEEITNRESEASAFLTCCRLAHDVLNTEQEKFQFLKLLPTRLRGRALELAQGKTFNSIEDLHSFLKEHFFNNKSYLTMNNDLRMVQQFPGETLSSYLIRVKKLLNSCIEKAREHYPNGGNVIAEELQEIAIHSFKLGILNPNQKFFLFQDTESSLDALAPKIHRLEQTEKYMFYPMLAAATDVPSVSMNPMYTNFSPVCQGQNSPILSMNPMPEKFTTVPVLMNSMPTNCTPHCQGQNSPVSMNPMYKKFTTVSQAQNNFSNHSSSQSESRSNNTKFRCGFCNRPGHTYAECRTRKATPYCTYCKVYGHNNQTCQKKNSSRGNVSRYESLGNDMNRVPFGRSRQSKQVNILNTGISTDDALCNFCLQGGHHEERCFARERWEKLQLQNRLESLQSENEGEAVADTPTRL